MRPRNCWTRSGVRFLNQPRVNRSTAHQARSSGTPPASIRRMSASGEHVEIVVIGAGVAGLAAAGDLHQAGFSLRVIEARDRIGGRILTIRDADTPMPIELGAEFVHGRAPELYEVIDAASLTAIDIAGSRWTPMRTTLAPLDDFWEQVERVMHGLKRFARRRDRSFDEFLAT